MGGCAQKVLRVKSAEAKRRFQKSAAQNFGPPEADENIFDQKLIEKGNLLLSTVHWTSKLFGDVVERRSTRAQCRLRR